MTAAPTCATHRRRPGPAVCAECGRRLCRDCAQHTRVGIKCGGCAAGRAVVTSRPAGPARRRVALSVVVGAVALVAAGAWSLLRGPATPPTGVATTGRSAYEPVVFDGAVGTELRGTLDLPGGSGPHPAVVVLPGFGATTRDGVPAAGGTDPLYRDLAGSLTDVGVAVLRYDKRGTGDNGLPDGQTPTFDQRTEDAVRAVAYLRQRPDIDPEAIAVVGHDEGGLIGLRIADAALDLAALVLINTPGRPLGDVLVAEYEAVGDDAHRAAAAELDRAIDALVATGTVPEVSGMLEAVFAVEPHAYLREVLRFDPAGAAERVTVPVLIVHGQRDSSITAADVAALRAALTLSPRVEVLSRAEVGHTLAREPDDGATAGSDADGGMHAGGGGASARDRDALERIAGWLAAEVGGDDADAADAQAIAWRPLAPSPLRPRVAPAAAWTGSELIVWGGAACTGLCDPDDADPLGDGAAYDPATDHWRSLPDAPLSPRFDTTTPRRPWPGVLVVWGGNDGEGPVGDGALYDPATDAWQRMAASPLAPRSAASSVWTGREVIVWGGTANDQPLGDGAAYDPGTDRWRGIAAAPLDPRLGATVVWTGREMIVWGGQAGEEPFADGAAYDPEEDSWRPLARSPLSARLPGPSVWTGEELLVLGGRVGDQRLTDGAAYDPDEDAWRVLATSGVLAREATAGAWADGELVVWGGFAGGQVLADGAVYDPGSDGWRPLPAWRGRAAALAAWADGELVVWGGLVPARGGGFEPVADGARLRWAG